jgi:hypothetical protein
MVGLRLTYHDVVGVLVLAVEEAIGRHHVVHHVALGDLLRKHTGAHAHTHIAQMHAARKLESSATRRGRDKRFVEVQMQDRLYEHEIGGGLSLSPVIRHKPVHE